MTSAPPPLSKYLGEVRAVGELAQFVMKDTTAKLPRGDGHSVIVYPGLIANDTTTHLLRSRLANLGYDVHGWEQGQNQGLQRDVMAEVRSQLVHLCRKSGRKVSLFGWSLGGLFAREVAKRRPDCVRLVITAGTPCSDFRANHAWKTYEKLSGHKVDELPVQTDLGELPPVPVTAIYSDMDGIVSPDCMDIGSGERHESIKVQSTHMGLVWSREVLAIAADRLAQPEGEWSSFLRPQTEAQ